MASRTTGTYETCVVCAVGKSEQQAHPEQATYYVQCAYQLVTVDTMVPITPQVLGGYNYVTNLVDQHTKYKEVLLIKEKTVIVNHLKLFNRGLVIVTRVRLDRLTADKGTALRGLRSNGTVVIQTYSWSLVPPTPHSKLEQTSG